jgi:HSP20 family molecular chaperone IbpA
VSLGHGQYPRLNITEQDELLIIEATVPGLTKENIVIELDYWKNNPPKENFDETCQLHISSGVAKRVDGIYIVNEIHKSSFKRTISFSSKLCDILNLKVSLENGLLMIVIPKLSAKKPTIETKKIIVPIG